MDNIIQTPIIEEIEQSFLDYSMSVITDRAIPSAEDGLKPVARRILYTMFENGMFFDKGFSKCAIPVADTMGRYHPHGDASIYGSLVALSQPWTMRYPLISFHGNNGARDGDGPASYRYTECKLSPVAEALLENVKKDVTDWGTNYTEDRAEPVYLPAKFPNLLCNGTTGIAVAMACSFAPHNFTEVMQSITYLLRNPDCSIEDLMQFIQGPDFPTGGLIINKKELLEAYKTGRGRSRIRGEYTIETKNNKTQIVFTTIPYKVSKESLSVTLDNLCEEKKIEGITAIRDESNMLGVRFVIEIAKDADYNIILKKIFKLTDLETTYSFNQVALVNKVPKLLNLKQLLKIYLEHQKDVQKRYSTNELKKIQDKIHILDGLLIALEDIDNIIQVIKKSESAADAKTNLISKYKMTEIQAKAILDMKLSRLSRLEKVELENEKNSLKTSEEYHNKILTNSAFAVDELEKDLISFTSKFSDNRRSSIIQLDEEPDDKEIESIPPEDVVVLYSESGNIKRIAPSNFKLQKRNGKGVKTQDDIVSNIIRASTIDTLMIFSSLGKMYRILVNDIPEGTNLSKGVPIRSLISLDINEKIMAISPLYRQTNAEFVVFVTKKGVVKKTYLEEYFKTKKNNGIIALNLREGDELAAVTFLKDEDIILISEQGISIRFSTLEVGPISRVALGIKGIALKDNDSVISVLPIKHKTDTLAMFTKNGYGRKTRLDDFPLQKRGGKGLICYKTSDVTGPLVGAALVEDKDNILIMGKTTSICVNAAEVPTFGRVSIGNIILKGSFISSISKINI